MSEPRLLRTLAVPIGVALVFLVVTPKLCQRAISTAKVQQEQPKGLVIASTVPQEQPKGLVIGSPAPASGVTASLNFPPGLDAARIQYLVEIDQNFSAPATMRVADRSPVTQILFAHHYIEKQPDGTYRPTNEGLINVNGAVDSGSWWIVPVAQRKFVRIVSIKDAGDGAFDAVIRWRWEPGATFASLVPHPVEHDLAAEFLGGQGHWVLTHYVKEPDRDLR